MINVLLFWWLYSYVQYTLAITLKNESFPIKVNMINDNSNDNDNVNESDSYINYLKTRTYIAYIHNKCDRDAYKSNFEKVVVNGTLRNRLQTEIRLIKCVVDDGKITNDMKDVIPSGDKDNFGVDNDIQPRLVFGNCYYEVNLDNNVDVDSDHKTARVTSSTTTIIGMNFYRNLNTCHEFYGLTGDSRYDAYIKIIRPGIVRYLLLN